MSGNQLTNLDFLDREAQLYKQSKETLKNSGKLIDKAIKDNTKQEMEEVQNAVKALNDKVDRIMKTDFVKDKQDKIKSSREQMLKSIEMASQAFFKVRTIILDKDSLNQEQKQQYIKKLYDKIIEKFMTAEEKKLFEQIIAGNGIIIMNGNGIRLGGGMGGIGGGGMGGIGGGGMGGIGGGGMGGGIGGMLGF